MNSGDLLLRWASCFDELRVARVQLAARRLTLPPEKLESDDPRLESFLITAKRLSRNLIRLGHLEERTREVYRTVPPTVLLLSGDRHLLTGCRSDKIRGKFSEAHGVSQPPPVQQEYAPAAWYLEGNEKDVTAASERIGVHVCHDRWGEVLASLPPLSDVLAGASSTWVPEGIEKWNPLAYGNRAKWIQMSTSTEPGFYRTIQKPHQWYFRLTPELEALRLDTPERQFAAAWLLRTGSTSVCYERESKILSITAIGFSLPMLVDRGLIMASGLLPKRTSKNYQYSRIDLERAQNVARILDTNLKVMP